MSDRLALATAAIGADLHARSLALRHHGEGRPRAPSVHEMAVNVLAALDGEPAPLYAPPLDLGKAAQAAAEAHLDACWAAHEDPELKSPSYALFCGCQTCCVRECLTAAWDILVKHGEV